VSRRFAGLPASLGLSDDRLRKGALGLLALAACLGMAGGTWDAAWHVTLRREGFWSPPHVLLYAGTTLGLLASLAGLLSPWRERKSLLRTEPGFLISVVGALIVIGAAPVDDFWHRTFGPDVDVWSFPHLLALAGGACINVGGAISARLGRDHGRHPPLLFARLELLFLTVLMWLAMFSMNWYTLVLARVRDSLEYPLLTIGVATAVLVLSTTLLGRGGATVVAGLYMLYTAAAHELLAAAGFAHLPFPPIVLLGAIAVDLAVALSRPRARIARGFIAGAIFAPVFILSEAASLAWYPHPALPPPRSAISANYYDAVANHPWDADHLAFTTPLGILVGGIAGVAGAALGNFALKLESQTEAHVLASARHATAARGVRIVH
jgi:hypothetical protein